MKIGKSGLVLWGLYGAFALFAVFSNLDATTFRFSGPLGAVKAIVWLVLLGFLGYSFYSTFQENFFRSVRSVMSLYWGRQICADLYIGLFIAMFIIFLNEGAVVALIWLLPILVYANLVVLLYVALNFESIVTKMLGLQG